MQRIFSFCWRKGQHFTIGNSINKICDTLRIGYDIKQTNARRD